MVIKVPDQEIGGGGGGDTLVVVYAVDFAVIAFNSILLSSH